MHTVLVVNVKGGCGKSTIATHLAAAFASVGHSTSLADLDKQRSSLGWLTRRAPDAAPIAGLDWTSELGKSPKGDGRLVIDAPAALRKKEVEALIAAADVIVLPVLPGAFDEEATLRFLHKLDALKPIAKNKVPVAVVGNRLRARTRAAARLDEFLGGVGHTVVARLRDSQLYPEMAAIGSSVLEQRGKRALELRTDWMPLLNYVEKGF